VTVQASPNSIAPQVGTSPPVLDVYGLTVEFRMSTGWTRAVDDVSFEVCPGETVGLVGESGCGKTVTMLSLLGLTRRANARVSGSAVFEGNNLLAMADNQLARIRGNRVGTIFQQPSRSLNPAFKVGEQIAETIRHHRHVGRKEAWRRAVQLLDDLAIPKAKERAEEYPHTFSGGMCQRVMIAIALSCDPALLIADEPTTALDVTVQAAILDLLRDIQNARGIAIVLISHDLGVVAQMCDRTNIMYAGQVVESAATAEMLARPRHPYTEGLLRGLPENMVAGRLQPIPGNVPPLDELPAGCRFGPRCAYALDGECDARVPPLALYGERVVRCLRTSELHLQGVVPR
jgi:peptide/nickel transport system ATP-binding protein